MKKERMFYGIAFMCLMAFAFFGMSCFSEPTPYYSSTPSQTPPSSSSPNTAPSVPNLQAGRYAASGTNITMSLSGFTVTAYSGYNSVGSGTYQITGNQLVIRFMTGYDAGQFLQGRTYVYTITSSTSFSGNGETWVRTGF